jgi:hypothetical protein
MGEMVKSSNMVNMQLLVDAKKFNADVCKAAEEHDRVVKEIEDLRARLAESENA